MTKKVIGPTGDYSTWAAFHTAVATPLTDDYEVEVQAGTYNEEMTWNRNNDGHTVYVYNTPGTTPVFHAQTTRSYACQIQDGGLKIQGIKFRDATSKDVLIAAGAGPERSDFLDLFLEGGPRGITCDEDDAVSLDVLSCYFLDQTDRSMNFYNGAAADVKRAIGCRFHCGSGGAYPSFGIEAEILAMDGSRGEITGCRFTSTDMSNKFYNAIGCGSILVKRCRAIGMRADGFRAIWGSTYQFEDCYSKKVAPMDGWQGFLFDTAATTVKILRCLFDGHSNGIRFTKNGLVATVENCGFINCDTTGILVDAGATVNNSHNGYRNCLANRGGAGTYNDPEVGEVTADPQLGSGYDGVVPPETSPWHLAGTDDGLPIIVGSTPDIGCEQIMPANLMGG